VRLEEIRGSVAVENENGSVSIREVRGAARVRTSFGPVFVRAVGGAVDVQNQNGSVAVAGLGSSCHPVTLRTSFAPIKVSLRDGADYTVNARTTYAGITTAIPIVAKSTTNESLTGTIGSGTCRMELANANGSIAIERE
jgi:DUF4097 and DUF4098 domain-containing protein YvlB